MAGVKMTGVLYPGSSQTAVDLISGRIQVMFAPAPTVLGLIKDGRVKRAVIPDNTLSGAQGWFINTRRPQFKDRRLREALIDAFDFEWTNKTIMYNAYHRTVSVFQNSDLMAVGLPSTAELKLLEPFRNRLPAEVFGEPILEQTPLAQQRFMRHFYGRPARDRIAIKGEQAVFAEEINNCRDSPLTPTLNAVELRD